MKREEKKVTKNKREFAEWLAVKAELPSDSLGGEARIELRGRHTLFLQGCKKILNYSPEKMVLLGKSCIINVKGERLICSSYHDGTVTIDGMISGVSFEEEGEIR